MATSASTKRTLLLTAALLLQACGGGGGGGGPDVPTPSPPPAPAPDGSLDDLNSYSSAANASLPGFAEAYATTQQQLVVDGQSLSYTANAGHLIAREPAGEQRAQAAVFHVAYTLNGATAANRPLIFFYNGGPGSASVWLHLGSFGPKRLPTGVPAMTAARPFPLIDNAHTLLTHADLVFVNAVGSGRSQAIAPFTNQSFWGVDADAALFRDFIRRYVERHNRQASPKFLYGESYGGPRTAVLARRLQESGLPMDGLVLQSPAMDYNSNCGVAATPTLSCAGYLPSYAAVGAWHGLTQPVPTDIETWLTQARTYTANPYAPAVQQFLASGTPDLGLVPQLVATSGLGATHWQAQFNLGPQRYRQNLLTGQLIGRYDGRMAAPTGSALAADGDPSSTWIGSSFAQAIDSYLRDVLRYRNNSTYVLSSNAIQSWDFRHEGRPLPDTIPDLAAVLAAQPRLRVLSIAGHHDLATPFHLTELDMARLGADPRVRVRSYPGGHMSFLDDVTRVRQRAELIDFIAETLAARGSQAPTVKALGGREVPLRDQAGEPVRKRGMVPPEPAIQGPMCDPCVPDRRPLS